MSVPWTLEPEVLCGVCVWACVAELVHTARAGACVCGVWRCVFLLALAQNEIHTADVLDICILLREEIHLWTLERPNIWFKVPPYAHTWAL